MIKIEGTEQVQKTAEQLALAGNVTLMKEMRRGIRTAVQPVKAAIIAEALNTLPKGGGANVWVAESVVSVGVRPTAKVATVSVTARKPGRKSGHDLKSINEGVLRHPTFGYRKRKWSDTAVRPGFFTRPCEAMAPAVRFACDVVVERTAFAAGFTDT